MPDSYTDNFSLVLPEPGGSIDTWGDKLNENFSQIDTIMTDRRATALTADLDMFNLPWTGNRFIYYAGSGGKPANYPSGADDFSEGVYLNRGSAGVSTTILINRGTGKIHWTRASNGTGTWHIAADMDDLASKLNLSGGSLSGQLDLNGKLVINHVRPQFSSDAFYSSGNLYLEGPTGGDDLIVRISRRGVNDYDWNFYGDVNAESGVFSGSFTVNGNSGVDGTLRVDGTTVAGGRILVDNANYQNHLAIKRGAQSADITLTTAGSGAVDITSTAAPKLRFNSEYIATENYASSLMSSHVASGDHDGRYYTKSQVDSKLQSASVGAVGTYGLFALIPSNVVIDPGDVVPGSDLLYAGTSAISSTSPSGSWRCMGFVNGPNRVTLFFRIS